MVHPPGFWLAASRKAFVSSLFHSEEVSFLTKGLLNCCDYRCRPLFPSSDFGVPRNHTNTGLATPPKSRRFDPGRPTAGFPSSAASNRLGFLEHDLGAASTYLSLEATARGLVAHQMAGILPDRAREVYQIPDGFRPLTALYLQFYETHSTPVP